MPCQTHHCPRCHRHREGRGRISVPIRGNPVVELVITQRIDATAINGLAVNAVIEGRVTNNALVKRFAMVISEHRPGGDYLLPVL